jgi:hypothetical protein
MNGSLSITPQEAAQCKSELIFCRFSFITFIFALFIFDFVAARHCPTATPFSPVDDSIVANFFVVFISSSSFFLFFLLQSILFTLTLPTSETFGG